MVDMSAGLLLAAFFTGVVICATGGVNSNVPVDAALQLSSQNAYDVLTAALLPTSSENALSVLVSARQTISGQPTPTTSIHAPCATVIMSSVVETLFPTATTGASSGMVVVATVDAQSTLTTTVVPSFETSVSQVSMTVQPPTTVPPTTAPPTTAPPATAQSTTPTKSAPSTSSEAPARSAAAAPNANAAWRPTFSVACALSAVVCSILSMI